MANGQSFSSSSGAVGHALSIGLLGLALSTGGGIVTPAQGGSVGPLTGAVITSSPGSILSPNTRLLTTSLITSNTGSPGVTLRPTNIVLPTLSISKGNLTASGPGGKTVNLNDPLLTINVTPGTLTLGPVLGGSSSTFSTGTLTWVPGSILTGSSSSLSLGTLGANQDVVDTYIRSATGTSTSAHATSLTGSSTTLGTGTIVFNSSRDQAMLGSGITSAPGTITFDHSKSILGITRTFGQGQFGAPGFQALTGQTIISSSGSVFTTGNRSYALTGISQVISQASLASTLSTTQGGLPGLAGQVMTVRPGTLTQLGGELIIRISGASLGTMVGLLQGRVLGPDSLQFFGQSINVSTGQVGTGSFRLWTSDKHRAPIWKPQPITQASQFTYTPHTNLLLYSAQLDNPVWVPSGVSITPNAVLAPDGTLTAAIFTNDATTNPHETYQDLTSTPLSGDSLTLSGYMRAGTSSYISIYIIDAVSFTHDAFAVFTLTGAGTVNTPTPVYTGTIVPITTMITNVGGGWYRGIVSFSTQSFDTGAGVFITLAVCDNVGVDTVPNITASPWGFQLEAGNTAGPYISTTSTPRTALIQVATPLDWNTQRPPQSGWVKEPST